MVCFPIFSRGTEIFLQWHQQAFAACGLPRIDPEYLEPICSENQLVTHDSYSLKCAQWVAQFTAAVQWGLLAWKWLSLFPSAPIISLGNPLGIHLYFLFSGIIVAVVPPMFKSLYLSGEKLCFLELVDHITEIQETHNVCWVFSLPRLPSGYDFCDSLCVLEWYVLLYHYLSIFDLHNVLIWKWRQIYSACLGPFQWMMFILSLSTPSSTISKPLS